MSWTITNPAGAGTVTLASLALADPEIEFRTMGVSTARMGGLRPLDSEEDWWPFDTEITLYLDGNPQYTGRVQESPDSASGRSSRRDLFLADAWKDFSEVIYCEPWGVGSGSQLYPRAILGLNAAGVQISTGGQIGEVIDYLIERGVNIAKGTIATGHVLWPSEVRNVSCESIIVGEMRFHPDWVAWLDHTVVPPVFHARPKSDLDAVTIDILEDKVAARRWAEVKRNVPLGVEIVYESASTIDGEVYRTPYIDSAGEVSGRRVMRAMLDLEGMDMQTQKARVRTRDIPDEGDTEEEITAQKDFLMANFPKLADLPLAAWTVENFQTALVPDPGGHPDEISPQALRLIPEVKSEIPRQLVNGQIEDWMRKKVGQITVTYDLVVTPEAGALGAGAVEPFAGESLTFTITATNATTRRYKGISSFTEGEGRPVGLAAALFASATEQQYEGFITTAHDATPPGRWHGKRLIVKKGLTTLIPAAVVTNAAVSPQSGRRTISFGPMPHLTAGDFLELQRLFNRRPPKWMSPEERTSNEIGSESNASSKGDTVTGYDQPQTIVPPRGGGGAEPAPLTPFLWADGVDTKLSITPGLIDSITPTLGAASLTDDPAPSVTLTTATKLWLVLEFEPESENEGSLYWIAPGGTLISAEFELSATKPAETEASVTEAGVVTNGVYSILWAEITEVSGNLTLAVTRTGNRITGFCPPNVLTYFPG